MRAEPRLTPAVHRLVTPDTIYPPKVGRLTTAQVQALTQVARTPDRFDQPVSAPRAVRALARGANADAVVPVLAQILGRKAADVPTRVAAAHQLALIATPGAERALWRGTAGALTRVLQEALWGLGAVGRPAALRRLAKLPTPADLATRRQLVFARALIAHRHGLATDGLPAIEADPRRPEQIGHQTSLTLTLQTAAATMKDARRLEGSAYGIELAGRSAHVACGAEWTVFFNRELEPAAMAARLRERPWVLGLMARWHRDLRVAAVAYVILSRPDGAGVRLDVVRGDGVRAFTGHATIDGPGVRVVVTDVDRPGTAPTYVRFRLSARGIEIEQAAVSSRRAGVRSTIAVPTSRAANEPAGVRPADKGVSPWR